MVNFWITSGNFKRLCSHLDAKLNFVSQITFQFLELLPACAWGTGLCGAQSGKAFLPRCITFCIKCHVTFITLGSCRHSVLMENFSSPIFSITLGGKSLVGALGKTQSSVLGHLAVALLLTTQIYPGTRAVTNWFPFSSDGAFHRGLLARRCWKQIVNKLGRWKLATLARTPPKRWRKLFLIFPKGMVAINSFIDRCAIE